KPADVDEINLGVRVVFSDGTSEIRNFQVQTETGEIQPVANLRAEAQPRVLQDQLTTNPALTDEAREGLAGALSE
ncbi:MAG: hypothetical protein AAFR70_11535, partial [Pseudomonadota bacterium]